MMKLCRLFCTLLCSIWSNLLVTSDAIIIHPDVPDSKYVVNVAKTPFFVSLGQRGDCAGTVVTGSSDKMFVLSAAHCFCANGRKTRNPTTIIFSDGSKTRVKSDNILFHPSCKFSCAKDGPNKCDIAIMKLSPNVAPTTVQKGALPVYKWSDERGKTIDIYGFGVTGNAAKFTNARRCNNADLDGKFRHGQNVVTSVSKGLLLYKMDCNSPSTSTEALAGSGDSGGPAVITRNGQRYLAGINSGSAEHNECDCDTTDQYHRVSDSYADFILPTIGDPAPTATCGNKDGTGKAVTCRPGLTAKPPRTPCGSCGDDGHECCTDSAKVPSSPGTTARDSPASAPTTCAKCVYSAWAETRTCCARGGAWFKRCGPGEEHTWVDGTRACSREANLRTTEQDRRPKVQTRRATRSATTTATARRRCLKCGMMPRTRLHSCCARGGAWFGDCGNDGDESVGHTWSEGIQVCKVPAAKQCSKCGKVRRTGQRSCCAPGGAWFRQCGDAEDWGFRFSWMDGIRACQTAGACPKCGTEARGGKRSCCARGGAWFGNCGDEIEPGVGHTWVEGVRSCNGASALAVIGEDNRQNDTVALQPTNASDQVFLDGSACPRCGSNGSTDHGTRGSWDTSSDVVSHFISVSVVIVTLLSHAVIP